MVNEDRDRIAKLGRAAGSALAVHHALQRQPIATSTAPVKATTLTAATVNKSLGQLTELGIVSELTNRRRGRVFSYRRYIEELTTELERRRPRHIQPPGRRRSRSRASTICRTRR